MSVKAISENFIASPVDWILRFLILLRNNIVNHLNYSSFNKVSTSKKYSLKKKQNDKQIILFLGSHRTGTKLLSNFFKKNFENVASYHQFDSSRWLYILSNMFIQKLLPESIYKKVVYFLIIRRIEKNDKPVYIETNGFNYIAAKYIKEYFENVKIVHIVRDPRDFVSSYLNWIHGRFKSWIANKLPFWNVSGALYGDVSRAEWKRMNEFQRFCWYWKFKNETISDLYSDDKNNYMCFRFEDLISSKNNAPYLKQLIDFLAMPYSTELEKYFNKKQNESNKGYFKYWKEWDSKTSRQLANICFNVMKKYYYGIEHDWINKLAWNFEAFEEYKEHELSIVEKDAV